MRKVLVMSHEVDFKELNKEAQDILDQFALSFVSTDINESSFQRCLQREQAGKYCELFKEHDRLKTRSRPRSRAHP